MKGRSTPGATPSSESSSTRQGPMRQYCSSRMWPSPHPRRAEEPLGGQREDLLLVLRVGAVGEPLLPPGGMLFPVVLHGPGRYQRLGPAQGADELASGSV